MKRRSCHVALAPLAVLVMACAVTGCSAPGLKAAEEGDYARMRSEFGPRYEAGKLTNGQARDLARAVAAREIGAAKNDDAATKLVRETSACASDLDGALEDRMQIHDGAGAA